MGDAGTPISTPCGCSRGTTGGDPEKITTKAIQAIGGMTRFVKAGDDVIVKPNICNAYHGPEYASTTNPIVVATLVTLAKNAEQRRLDYWEPDYQQWNPGW